MGVIKSLKGRGLRLLYERGDSRGIHAELAGTVEKVLNLLDSADSPKALDLPRYRLHALKGDRAGYWAVTIRANWRIIFRIQDGHATDVELIDYH